MNACQHWKLSHSTQRLFWFANIKWKLALTICQTVLPSSPSLSASAFLHIARRSELQSVLKEKRVEIKVGHKCTEMECKRMFWGGVAVLALGGFKDLTIPHPLSLSFISNNQAWPQNIPLDRVERARVRGEKEKNKTKTCCLSASHSSLG